MLYLQKDENNNGKKKIEEIYNNYRRLMYFIAFKVVGNEADTSIG